MSKKVTESSQKAVAEILTDLIFEFLFKKPSTLDTKRIKQLYDKYYNDYNLNEDPFTKLPCSNKDYAKSNLEYSRQSMLAKYDHHDGF